MTEKELLLAFMAKALNMDATGVTSLIYDEEGTVIKANALDTLLTKQSENVNRIKQSAEAGKLDDGHRKGFKEAMEKVEAQLKEKFEIATEATGTRLIEEIAAKSTASNTGTPKELTDDDVKKHRLYLDLQATLRKQATEADAKLSAEIEKVNSTWKRNESMREIKNNALEYHLSRKPILPKNEQVAKNQQKLLLDELELYDFEIQGEGENKRIIILDKQTRKIKEDALGHPVQFDALITSIGDRYYEFEASDERSSPGDPNGKGKSGGAPAQSIAGVTLRKPTSQDDWFKQHDAIEKNATLKPEERRTLQADLLKLHKGEPAATV
jgi:hypothetical protein